MMREYLKLTRLFNMGLTGIASVLGALSMWSIGNISLPALVVLFLIGCLSHIYGFVFNDYLDVEVDKMCKEFKERPLVSGTITKRNALAHALGSMFGSWALVLYFYRDLGMFLALLSILICADLLATAYNLLSKKLPCMDIFVAGAVFLLIIFGAATVSFSLLPIAWIIACIGFFQVLFMNMIYGALKDLGHDLKAKANTLAIRLGARINNGSLSLPWSFKTIGFTIESCRSFLVFSPFLLLLLPLQGWQLVALIVLTGITFYLIWQLLSMKSFERNKVRKRIALVIPCMYATTPVMLSAVNFYIILLALLPPIWFLMTSFALYRAPLTPKTM